MEQLSFAFELWAVRPFSLMEGSPDARDLVNCSLEFAKGAFDQGCAAFESELVSILQVTRGSKPDRRLDSARIAHILTAAVRGFKASAQSREELRGMIDGLLTITLDA